MLASFSNAIDRIYNLKTQSRFASIEGLRAWAIIMVFNVHFFAQYYRQSYFLTPDSMAEKIFQVLHSGYIGVDLFFVISGFLIYRSLCKNNPSPVKFFEGRINRLLPAHILVLLWVSSSSFKLKNFLINVVFLPVFIKDTVNYNYVTWSLGWEWLFYFLIFIVFSISKRKSDRYLISLIAALGILAFIFQWLAAPKLEIFRLIIPDAGRFLAFFVGVLVALIESGMKPLISRHIRVLCITSIIALLIILLMSLLWTYKDEVIQQNNIWRNSFFITVSLCFGLILLRVVTIKGTLNQILEFKPFRMLGQISYSFYLVHAIIGIPLSLQIFPFIDTFQKMIISYIVSILVTFFLATFIFYYFERPYLLKKSNNPQSGSGLAYKSLTQTVSQ